MTGWVVGYEQRKPYEFIVEEVYEEEADAIYHAEALADGKGGVKLSTRTWRLPEDGQYIVVRKDKR